MGTKSITVCAVDDSEAQEWNAYASSVPEAGCYHDYKWRDLVHTVFGHDTHYLAARDSAGRFIGVLPAVRLKSLLFGDFLVSLPYVNEGGILADCNEARSALMTHFCELAQRLAVTHAEFRHSQQFHPDMVVRTDKVRMVLELPREADTLLQSLKPKVRARIRRPIKEGAKSKEGGAELLADFYRVFSANMRDLGTPTYPKAFFREICARFTDRVRIVIVYANQDPIAAGFLVSHGARLEIPWGATLPAAKQWSANMLLYWAILESAIQQGYGYFDFGRCSRDSGTYDFKKQWGAEPVQLYWHYWLREGAQAPMISPANPKYHFAINAWKRLPLPMANWLGPKLVKNLP